MESNFTKASGAANVGLFALTLLSTALLIRKEFQAPPTGVVPVGNSMNWPLWILSFSVLAAACLYMAATVISTRKSKANKDHDTQSNDRVYMSEEERQKLLDERKTANEKYLSIKTAHEPCERTIHNLQSKANRLETQNETQQVQIGSRQGQIDQLTSELEQLQWLKDIARDQAAEINKFVLIDNCQIYHAELFRPDPYIEFAITVSNHSIYEIRIPDIQGRMRFVNREFSLPAKWKDSSREIAAGAHASFVFRQTVTTEERTHILNHAAHFDFMELRFGAETIDVPLKQIHLQNPPPTNEPIFRAYPKLQIENTDLLATMIVNLRDFTTTSDGIFTTQLTLKNLREVPITIESFHLDLTVQDQTRTVSSESGEIWDKKHINEAGELSPSHDAKRRLPNLSDRLPLAIRQAQVTGAIQFVLPGIGATMLNHPGRYKLVITDTSGEMHPLEGTVGPRPEEVRL